jgi:hypothetical protein
VPKSSPTSFENIPQKFLNIGSIIKFKNQKAKIKM